MEVEDCWSRSHCAVCSGQWAENSARAIKPEFTIVERPGSRFSLCTGNEMPVAPSSEKTSRPVGSAATTKKTDAVFKEYSKIKNFRFDIGGKWDDKNVCIFLPCYRETIKECSDYSKKNIDFWAKIAERGIASGGSRECFSSVNYCMELAERLKEFVQKYDKELEGVDAFDELKKDVSDLLPYFPPPEYDNIERMKNPTPAFEGDNVELILKVSHDHLHRFGRACVKYTVIFSAISKEVSSISGVQTDVKPILEKLKRDVIKTLGAEPDPQKRARMFPRNFTIFDFVEPRDIKKKNYVPVETTVDLTEPKISLKGKTSSIESNGGLKALEPPPLNPRQTDDVEVDLSEVSSSTKPDNEQEDSDRSASTGSVDQMDVDENHSVETVVLKPVETPKRGRGRPKGALNKEYRRDASPIMTRGLRRSRESAPTTGSESESNRNAHTVGRDKSMMPFVSIVRIPLQKQAVSTRQLKNVRARNGVARLQKKDSHVVPVARRQKKTGTEFDFARPYSNGPRTSPIVRARRSFSPGNGSDGSSGSGKRKLQRGDKISSLDFYNRSTSGASSSLQSHESVEEEAAVPAHMPRSYHPSTYSARVNEPHCPIESGTPWSRSVVPRGRPRGTGYGGGGGGGGMETTVYRGGDRDLFGGSPDFSRELILKYEDLEKKKLVVIQKMHSEVVHEMKRTNDLLAMLLRSQK